MKKVWICLFCLLLVTTIAVTVFAENDTKITVTADKTTVHRGDVVTLTVSMSGSEPVTSVGITIKESDSFTLLSGEIQPALLSVAVMSDFSDNVLAAAFTKANTINGDILVMTVQVNDDSSFDVFSVIQSVAAKNGKVVVTCELEQPTLTVVCKHTYGPWTESGSGHKQTCSICGDEVTAGHKWNDGVIAPEPTCKNDGVKTFTCADCGATKTEAVPATGSHSFGNGVKLDEYSHTLSCATCDETKNEAHAWDNGVITAAPTCKNSGVKTFTCAGCGATEAEELPVSEEHTFTDWSSLNEDIHGRSCSVCQKEETGGHSFEKGACAVCGLKLEYTVVFLDEDGAELSKATYYYGDEVTVPQNPTKAADKTYTYEFAGWDQEVVACTGDATYKASYTATYIEYAVTFLNEDGTELSKAAYHYGDAVIAPENPTKAADMTYTYEFAGWDQEVVACTGDATYKARYTATYIEYTVTFLDEEGNVISSNTYHYGDALEVPADREKEADAYGEYVFEGWGQELTSCQGDAEYTAQFTYKHYPPDYDKTGEVTDSDAIYLLRHTLFPDAYTIVLDGDVNSDGEVNDADAIYLLRHTLFPEKYPLYPGGKKA